MKTCLFIAGEIFGATFEIGKISVRLSPFASRYLWRLLPEFNLLVTLEILLWEEAFNPWPLITQHSGDQPQIFTAQKSTTSKEPEINTLAS